MRHDIKNDDVLEWAKNYDGEKFHALLCDPPYHLTSTKSRSSKGFMGKTWDGGDVAYRPETWAALAEHLHDGAFGMAFAGSRGWHRMAVAIEDAGLIIHPTIFGWAYGSGFPKATRIDSQIDKAAKVDCPDCGDLTKLAIDYLLATGYEGDAFADLTRPHYFNELTTKAGLTIEQTGELLALNTAAYNKRFQCNRCNGSGKVSAYDVREVVDTIKQPLGKNATFRRSTQFTQGYRPDGKEFGRAALGYLEITAPTTPLAQAFAGHRYGLQALKPAIEPIIVFQKPYKGKPLANITATGAGALNIDGGRIGTSEADLSFMDRHKNPTRNGWVNSGSPDLGYSPNPQGRWPANFILTHSPDCTDGDCAEQCPVRRLGEQSGVLKSGGGNGHRKFENTMWQGLGEKTFTDSLPPSQGTAARYFFNADWSLDVAEQLATADPVRYQAKASRKERDAGLERNPHPTVKPLTLTQHLATLLLPPNCYAPNRRLLVPFSGSGSEMIGALLAGWDFVQGIDLTAEYVEVAHARINHWLKEKRQTTFFED